MIDKKNRIMENLTKLQTILKERGITQRRLVVMVNESYPDLPINLNTVNRIITQNRVDIRMSSILRICGALNVSPNDILEY